MMIMIQITIPLTSMKINYYEPPSIYQKRKCTKVNQMFINNTKVQLHSHCRKEKVSSNVIRGNRFSYNAPNYTGKKID